VGGGLDVAQVGPVIWSDRCGHTDQEVAGGDRLRDPAQAAGRDRGAHEGVELGLDDVDPPGVDRVEHVAAQVDPGDAAAVRGQDRGRRQADVAEAQHAHVVLGSFMRCGRGQGHLRGMLSTTRDVVHPAPHPDRVRHPPGVIKLWPVDRALRGRAGFQVTLCNTGQHRELVPPLLATFRMVPEVELGVMSPGQSLSSLLARLLDGIDPVLDALRFDWVIVQGDTTTALAAALAAHHRHVPVAHVEAGLRTDDLLRPFPEEGNRQIIARVASLHLAPTATARDALLRERGARRTASR
jgi:hypothetical protein